VQRSLTETALNVSDVKEHWCSHLLAASLPNAHQ